MTIETTISKIKTLLNDAFSVVDTWFDKDVVLRNYRPTHGGWTINEILEHVGLTNHFLLILIEKGTNKAIQNIHQLDLQTELNNQVFQKDKLDEVGIHKRFEWKRPEHMEPTGNKPLIEIRNQLKEQLQRCLDCLDKMKNGEGVLYKTTMSVNNFGKLNVYEYIYFLGQHVQRHLSQMRKNEVEFNSH